VTRETAKEIIEVHSRSSSGQIR